MSRKLNIVAGKAAVALALGFATVTGASNLLQSRAPVDYANDLDEVTLASAQGGADLPDDPRTPQLPAHSLMPGKAEPTRVTAPARTAPPAVCTIGFTAEPAPGGMVRLHTEAPCHADTRIRIRHDQLVFDALTDGNGTYDVDLPALTAIAGFEAEIGGQTLRAIAAIPDFESYSHVALLWQGQTGLQIHALEFGASYGGAGHVWADAPQSVMRAVRARGGFLTRLGDDTLGDGKIAEIYSFPTGLFQRAGTVRLVVEAQVTPYSCGRSVNGTALQPDADETLVATDVTLEIPDCDAVGDILVLKNLLRDMKIASN